VPAIRDLPFVSKEEILDAYLPVQSNQSRETAYRRLRRDELISDGLALVLRGAAGRVRGRQQLYCALNRDAARLARHGREDEARALAEEADRLEGSEYARRFVGFLERAFSERSAAEPLRVFVSAPAGSGKTHLFAELVRSLLERDASVRVAVSGIVRDLDAVRARTGSLDEIQVKLYAKVARVAGELAELDVTGGRQAVLPVGELAELGLAEPGTPVVLLWERWGNGRVLVESEPAIELEGIDDTGSDSSSGRDFDPFAYGEVPVRGRAADELIALLRRPGTLRTPRPIELVSRG
jgi:hypothetical protein